MKAKDSSVMCGGLEYTVWRLKDSSVMCGG